VKWPLVSWKGAIIQRGLEPGGRKIDSVGNRYQETSSNIENTSVCVCVCVCLCSGGDQ
jgi:hypothetical protein